MKRLLCTGGGTAGHVVPAIPIMEAMLARGLRVDFVGSGSELERHLLGDLPVEYHAILTGKLRRYFSLQNLLDAFRVALGVVQALFLVGRLRPDVVFSKGGFVSFPVVFAAWCWRVPVVAHESDLSPGLANRLAMPFIRTLCVNFPVDDLKGYHPDRFQGQLLYTGTPVRAALAEGDPARGRTVLGVVEDRRIILVTGGSLGAERINRVVRDALDGLLQRGEVVHVCGAGGMVERARAGYHQFEYVDAGWGDLLAAADVVISRAGANTLYELLYLRKPNLLVPLPKKASRGDQIENAAYAEQSGFSRVIDEQTLDEATLLAAVDEILAEVETDSGKIAAFNPPDSVHLIVDAIERATD